MRSRASSGTPPSASGRDRCSCPREREDGGCQPGRMCEGDQGFLWLGSPCSARSCRRSQPWSRRRRASARRTSHRRTLPEPTSHTRARSCPSRARRPPPAGSRGTSSPACPQPPETAPEAKGAELGSAPPLRALAPPLSTTPRRRSPPLECANPNPLTNSGAGALLLFPPPNPVVPPP